MMFPPSEFDFGKLAAPRAYVRNKAISASFRQLSK
jgi:hypothetical protein